MSEKLFPRYALRNLRLALEDTPAVLIHGPRQCGKTTLAKMLGDSYDYVTFDDPDIRAFAKEDPIGFTAGLSDRTILDEVQYVPEIFSSLKRVIDQDRKSGRYVLTGSTNLMLLPTLSDSLAGRIEIQRLYPLAQCEIISKENNFLKRCYSNNLPKKTYKRLFDKLVEVVMAGGYPEPLKRRSAPHQKTWHLNYVNTIIQRDIKQVTSVREVNVMPMLMRRLANSTAQLLNANNIASGFKLGRKTVQSYIKILERMFLVDELKAWHANQNNRLIKTPKIHIGDTGIAAALMNINKELLLKDRTRLGHLVESFVYNELKREASWSGQFYEFYFYRDRDMVEVDLLIENDEGQYLGIEVKSGATISTNDLKGLKKVRNLLGPKFTMGVLLYDGERVLPFGDKLFAAPISVLWDND